MIDLLLLLIFLACVGIGAAWLAENPGSVTMYWFDYRIDTSVGVLLLGLLFATVSVSAVLLAIRAITKAPGEFSRSRRLKHYKQGLTELTYSVAALAASDGKTAEKHTRKAEKLLGKMPITLLLSAQVAKSRGDESKTRLLLEQLLEHEETEYLAARSLSEAASKQQLFPKALSLAQRAESANPKEHEAALAVISLHARLGHWQEALQAIDKAAKRAHIGRADIRRYKSLIYLQQGQNLLEAGQYEAALAAAREAVKLAPKSVPVVVFAAKAFAAEGQVDKAVNLILKARKSTPHPDLSAAFHSLIAVEPKEQQAKYLRKFASLPQTNSYNDFAWVCSSCHQPSLHWETHCPSCNGFATLEWKAQAATFETV